MQMPRLFTAMVTPFDEGLQVNYSKAVEIAQYLVDQGSEGLVLTGTTGESPVLTTEEQLELFSSVKKAMGPKANVWGGTGSNNTSRVVALSKEAEKTGIDGLMIVAPSYNRPNQEGLYEHYKTIAEAVSLPIMVYNIPSRTGVNILPATMAKITALENIIAIKESCGDLDQVSVLKNTIKEDIYLYSGDDYLALPMMSLGAYGVVSVASHIVGKEIFNMLQAYVDGNVSEAQRLHAKLYPVFKGLFITASPIPVKKAMNLMGMNVGKLRLPLVEADQEVTDFIYALLKQYKRLG